MVANPMRKENTPKIKMMSILVSNKFILIVGIELSEVWKRMYLCYDFLRAWFYFESHPQIRKVYIYLSYWNLDKEEISLLNECKFDQFNKRIYIHRPLTCSDINKNCLVLLDTKWILSCTFRYLWKEFCLVRTFSALCCLKHERYM